MHDSPFCLLQSCEWWLFILCLPHMSVSVQSPVFSCWSEILVQSHESYRFCLSLSFTRLDDNWTPLTKCQLVFPLWTKKQPISKFIWTLKYSPRSKQGAHRSCGHGGVGRGEGNPLDCLMPGLGFLVSANNFYFKGCWSCVTSRKITAGHDDRQLITSMGRIPRFKRKLLFAPDDSSTMG